jgi:hypothetical protein
LLVRDTRPVTWLPPLSTGPWLPMSLAGPWKVFAGQGGASAGSVDASGRLREAGCPWCSVPRPVPTPWSRRQVRALAP